MKDAFERVLLIVALLAAITSAGAQTAPVTLSPEHSAALKPLMCDECVPISELVAYVQPFCNQCLGRFIKARTSTRPPTEADARSATPDLLKLVIKDTFRVKAAHVCVGPRVAAHRDVVVVKGPEAGPFFTFNPHPEGISAVCIGQMQPISAFMQSVVAGVFAQQLAVVEQRTSKEAVAEAIRLSLEDVLLAHKRAWITEVKRDVVAELKSQLAATEARGAPADAGDAQRCTSGVISCAAGVPLTQCCRCVDAGPPKFGVCNAQGSVDSWRPK